MLKIYGDFIDTKEVDHILESVLNDIGNQRRYSNRPSIPMFFCDPLSKVKNANWKTVF